MTLVDWPLSFSLQRVYTKKGNIKYEENDNKNLYVRFSLDYKFILL